MAENDPRVEGLRATMGDRAAVVSALVLAELRSLAVQGRIRGDLAGEVASLARVESVTQADALEGGRIHGTQRSKRGHTVSLADALILATARRLGAELLTLDGDLEGEEGVVVLPG